MSSLERVRILLPELEAAVYDPYITVSGCFPRTDPSDDDLSYWRTRRAMGPWCQESSKASLEFLHSSGLTGFRTEIHRIYGLSPSLSDGWLHNFLAEPANGIALSLDDLVVDATYLQFADNPNTEEFMATRPNVFVGTRAAIIDLMQDPEFNSDDTIAPVYEIDTFDRFAS